MAVRLMLQAHTIEYSPLHITRLCSELHVTKKAASLTSVRNSQNGRARIAQPTWTTAAGLLLPLTQPRMSVHGVHSQQL